MPSKWWFERNIKIYALSLFIYCRDANIPDAEANSNLCRKTGSKVIILDVWLVKLDPTLSPLKWYLIISVFKCISISNSKFSHINFDSLKLGIFFYQNWKISNREINWIGIGISYRAWMEFKLALKFVQIANSCRMQHVKCETNHVVISVVRVRVCLVRFKHQHVKKQEAHISHYIVH